MEVATSPGLQFAHVTAFFRFLFPPAARKEQFIPPLAGFRVFLAPDGTVYRSLPQWDNA